MYTTLLTLHIFGALMTGGVSIATLAAVHFRDFSRFTPAVARSVLYGLSAWQVFSGALLSVVSPSVTALSVCDHLALYFVVLAAPLIALSHLDGSRSRLETFFRQLLVGATILFIGTLAVGL